MPRPYMPPSMVITARRGRPGAERAQLMVDGQAAGQGVAATPAGTGTAASPAKASPAQSAAAAQVSDLLRQIRLAEAQGRPVDDLRQQLYQAVEGMQ